MIHSSKFSVLDLPRSVHERKREGDGKRERKGKNDYDDGQSFGSCADGAAGVWRNVFIIILFWLWQILVHSSNDGSLAWKEST